MVADEHGLKMSEVFKAPGSQSVPGQASAGAASQEGAALSAGAEDDLEERLRRLRS